MPRREPERAVGAFAFGFGIKTNRNYNCVRRRRNLLGRGINVPILPDNPKTKSHPKKTRPAAMLHDNFMGPRIERHRSESDQCSRFIPIVERQLAVNIDAIIAAGFARGLDEDIVRRRTGSGVIA